jgi:hypothetical protein
LRATTKQPLDARKPHEDVLDNAVGEVFLLWIPAQILKCQDSNRRLIRQREWQSGLTFDIR